MSETQCNEVMSVRLIENRILSTLIIEEASILSNRSDRENYLLLICKLLFK